MRLKASNCCNKRLRSGVSPDMLVCIEIRFDSANFQVTDQDKMGRYMEPLGGTSRGPQADS